MWEPSSEWSGLQRAESRSGKRPVKRRSTVRGVSPSPTSSSNRLVPVPSPPTCLVTHVVTSIVAEAGARLARGCALPATVPTRAFPGPGSRARPLLLAVEVFLEPAEVEGAEQLALGLAGLAVVVDRLVPDVQHAVPLLADVVLLRGTVHRLRAVAGRRVLDLGADAAAEVERAQDRGGAVAEAHRIFQTVVPSGGGRQGPSEVGHLGPEGERTAAERVLEVAPTADHADQLRHLLAVEGVDAA